MVGHRDQEQGQERQGQRRQFAQEGPRGLGFGRQRVQRRRDGQQAQDAEAEILIALEGLPAVQRPRLEDGGKVAAHRVEQRVQTHRIVGPAARRRALAALIGARDPQRDQRTGQHGAGAPHDAPELFRPHAFVAQIRDDRPQAAQHLARPDGRDHEQHVGMDHAGDAQQRHIAARPGVPDAENLLPQRLGFRRRLFGRDVDEQVQAPQQQPLRHQRVVALAIIEAGQG